MTSDPHKGMTRLTVVSALSLSSERVLALLVLSDLVRGVLLALVTLAVC